MDWDNVVVSRTDSPGTLVPAKTAAVLGRFRRTSAIRTRLRELGRKAGLAKTYRVIGVKLRVLAGLTCFSLFSHLSAELGRHLGQDDGTRT